MNGDHERCEQRTATYVADLRSACAYDVSFIMCSAPAQNRLSSGLVFVEEERNGASTWNRPDSSPALSRPQISSSRCS
ncbi:hypothetical protein XENOCAPTIV_008632 [Xenoophorus captivus]|uniref:Uncharacterized protein n=1 Tax=Xenoophorus captivus TaxID=1517983 RepID=A0ABV0R7Y0_9TELE